MLSENQVVKANAAARKAVESTYIGVCDVIEEADEVDKKSGITYRMEVTAFEKIPCRLSFQFGVFNAAEQSDTVTSVPQRVKLFVAPETDIKSGSKIVVTQNEITNVYKASGEAAVYATHREIVLVNGKDFA